MIGKTTNPLLEKTEQQITAKVPPDMQNAFQRIVLAGEKVMYSPQSRQMVIKQLQAPGDPAAAVGNAVAKLYGVLMNQSKGTMPQKAGIPAAVVLLCEGLDFAEKAKLLTVSPDVLATATHSMMSALMQLFGVDQNKLSQMAQAAQPAQPAAPATAAQPGGIVAQTQGAPA